MSLFGSILFLIIAKFCHAGNAPIFSLQTCDGGCKGTNDCPENAACIPILGQSCGVCLCTVKYTAAGDKCVPVNSGVANVTTTSSPVIVNGPSVDVTTTQKVPVITTVPQVVMTAVPPQWPPLKNFNVTSTQPPSTEFTCQTTKCPNMNLPSTEDENPLSIKSTKVNTTNCDNFFPKLVTCPNLVNGGQCVDGDCLTVSSDKSYCICPYDKVSTTCQEQKSGDCLSATGTPPQDGDVRVGKRFVHKRDADYGAILTRHYANSLKDCLRLCQWATATQCRSVNYGPIGGKMVCELITVMAKRDTILFSWLVDDPAWTYFCCFK